LKNGQLVQRFHFKNGKKDGKCESYSSRGLLVASYEYLNGKKDGNCKTWFESDFHYYLEYEIEFKVGKKHGKYLKYFNNGNVQIEMKFVNDKQVGKRIEYFKNGELFESV
jgi:uncharacterized protein